MSNINFKVPNVPDVGTRAKFTTILSADPAADAECTITVPADKYYKIISASVTCAQGITQTPQTSLQIADTAGNIVGRFLSSSAAQSASVTSVLNWFPGATLTAGAGLLSNQGPIPTDLIVPPGYVITTSTAGKGANTNHGKLALFVAELRP